MNSYYTKGRIFSTLVGLRKQSNAISWELSTAIQNVGTDMACASKMDKELTRTLIRA